MTVQYQQAVCGVVLRSGQSLGKGKSSKAEDWNEGPFVLLVKRKFPPFENRWALPGGFIKKDETPEKAFVREVKKECNIDITNAKCESLSIREKKERDPRGAVQAFPFLAVLEENDNLDPTNGDSVTDARWFLLTEVESLAFDHGAILCEALGYLWPMMNRSEKKSFKDMAKEIVLPDIFLKSSLLNSKKVVFFGGSFNPWHDGHKNCLNLCPEKNVIVVPDQNPWKKSGALNQCYWKAYVELSNQLESTPYSVYSGFWGSEKGNPTASWLPQVNAKEKWLLCGDDTFLQILDWKDSEKVLLSISGLYVVSRQCEDETDSKIEKILKSILKVNPQLQFVFLGGNEQRELSSTKMRQA